MEKLLSPMELATILGIAEQTVYNRKAQGMPLPPAVKLGRLLRFPEGGVTAWLKSLPSANSQVVLANPTTPIAISPRRGRPTKAAQIARRNSCNQL